MLNKSVATWRDLHYYGNLEKPSFSLESSQTLERYVSIRVIETVQNLIEALYWHKSYNGTYLYELACIILYY